MQTDEMEKMSLVDLMAYMAGLEVRLEEAGKRFEDPANESKFKLDESGIVQNSVKDEAANEIYQIYSMMGWVTTRMKQKFDYNYYAEMKKSLAYSPE